MTVESIVKIPVDDREFDLFAAKFAKYEEMLAKTPSAWKAVSKENAQAASAFERMAAALMAQNAVTKHLAQEERARQNALRNSESSWRSIAKSSASVAGNIANATKSLLRWTGILGAVGGLLGAGGLWGIDRLAENAADQRRTSMGLGMTTGAQRAFGLNFQRLVDPSSFLSWVNTMETDVSKQGPAYALSGGRGLSGNTANDAVNLLVEMRNLAKRTPTNQLSMAFGARGIQASPEEEQRLKRMGNSEFAQLIASFRRDQGALGYSDEVGRKWQDFTTQIDRAKSSIFSTFVQGLAPLAGPLQKLSDSFSRAVAAFMKSDVLREGIDKLSTWIDNLGNKMGSKDFQNSITQLLNDTSDIAKGLHNLAEAIRHPGETAGKIALKAGRGALASAVSGPARVAGTFQNMLSMAMNLGVGAGLAGRQALKDKWNQQSALIGLAALDASYKLPAGSLEYLWMKESSKRLDVPDKAGRNASGPFQLKTGVAGDINRHDFAQASKRSAELLALELKRYGGDAAKAIAAFHYGDPTLDPIIKQYGASWRQHLPDNYMSNMSLQKTPAAASSSRAGAAAVVIYVENNTGGSATVTASQLAAVQP